MSEFEESDDQTPNHDMPTIVSTIKVDDIELEINHPFGNIISAEGARVVLSFIEAKSAIVMDLTDSIVLGRSENIQSQEMYVDLTVYGAVEKGVSRRHAVLHRMGRTITITDLDSRNGTYLNGDRLVAHQVRFLRHSDEIHLGKLVFRIHFE